MLCYFKGAREITQHEIYNQTENSAAWKQCRGCAHGGMLFNVVVRQWNTIQEVQFEKQTNAFVALADGSTVQKFATPTERILQLWKGKVTQLFYL